MQDEGLLTKRPYDHAIEELQFATKRNIECLHNSKNLKVSSWNIVVADFRYRKTYVLQSIDVVLDFPDCGRS